MNHPLLNALWMSAMSIVLFFSISSCSGSEPDSPSGGSGNSVGTIPVSKVSLTPETITLDEGKSAILIATVSPDNATNKNVRWSSADASVATVVDGNVSALRAGGTTVTVTTEDGSKSASCTVTVTANASPSVTIGADHISAVSAILSGKANLGSTVASDLKMGIMWSTNAGVLPSNSTKVEASNMDEYYNYSVVLTQLDPETTYYFRSYITQNGLDNYGETQKFTTKEPSSLIRTQEATNLSAVSARVNARVDLTDVQCKKYSYGFYYGNTDDQTLFRKEVISEESGTISAYISYLKPSEEYLYQAYLILDGREFKAERMSFTTKDIESLLETKDATDIEVTSVKLNAKLDITDVPYSSISYGFYWGYSKTSLYEQIKCGALADKTFSCVLSNLPPRSQRWYKAFVQFDKWTFYGDIKTFTTDVIHVTSVSLDQSSYTFTSIGNSINLYAKVLPSNASDPSTSWSSNNERVATVDQRGSVKATGNGTAIITVTTNDQGKTATCAITVNQLVTRIILDKTSLSLIEGEIASVSVLNVLPDNANDKTVTWASSNTDVASVDNNGRVTALSKGKATITATSNDGSGVSASCGVIVSHACPAGAVDLGTLTAEGYKLYWATCNICETGFVSSPEKYGDYYAWGETEPYYQPGYAQSSSPVWKDGKTYDWASYRWCKGTRQTLTKYNKQKSYGIVDNKSVLEPSDDVAHVKLGGHWRMPTEGEWNELRGKCSWTWTTRNGVNGYMVTSSNGNSIFLPTAGFWERTNFRGLDYFGSYWSSSLITDGTFNSDRAWSIGFEPDYIEMYPDDRPWGESVRPVYAE